MKYILILLVLPFVVYGQATYNPCNGVTLGLVPDPNDETCVSYWSCVKGEGKKYNCPTGSVFERSLAVCILLDDEFVCPPPLCSAASTGVTSLPYPNECGRHFLCLEGGFLLERPCAPGLVYDYVAKGCEVPEKANCLVCPPENPAKLVYYPDKKNCNGYYLCANGVYKHVT